MMPLAQERPEGPSCAGVFVATARDDVLEVLASLGFSGWVGPQQDEWVLAVAENPLGAVASAKRHIGDLGRELGRATGSVTFAAQIRRDRALRLWLFDGSREVVVLDTDPNDDADGVDEAAIRLDEFGNPVLDTGTLDEFGEPVAVAGAGLPDGGDGQDEPEYAPLALALGRPEAAAEITELLQSELTEDESESERFTALAKLAGLPTWLVSANVLPKQIWGGPSRAELTRLHLGRAGASGAIAGALARRTTRRPPRA